MLIRDRSSDKPLYQVVLDELKRRISAGIYPEGSALPSETRLAEEFDVSSITVRRAMRELVLDGFIDRRQGLGSFVTDRNQNLVIGLSSFTADVSAGNLRLTRTLLVDQVLAASEPIAAKLDLQPGSPVRYLARLDAQGDHAFSLDEAYLPLSLAGTVTGEVAASPLFFELWQAASGIEVARLDFELSVEMPSRAHQEALLIGPDAPLLVCGEVGLDAAGNPVSYTVTRYRADRVRLIHSAMMSQKARP